MGASEREKHGKKQLSYQEQRELACERQITALKQELPPLVSDFVRSMEAVTTPLTRLGYLRDLRIFFRYLTTEVAAFREVPIPAITGQMLNQITLRDLEIYQSYLRQYTRQTDQQRERNRERGLSRKLSALRAFFRYLYKHGLLEQNLTERLEMPKLHQKPVLYLNQEEIRRLMETVVNPEALSDRQRLLLQRTQQRDLAILCLLLGTGIRASELVGLDLKDLRLETGEFVVTRKGGGVVTLMFNEQVRQALADYLAVRRQMTPLPGHEQALFLSIQNRRLTVRALENLVQKYTQIAIPLKQHLSPHKMRSTFGTNLYLASGDINLVAEMLGHRSVNTTKKHYVGNSESEKARAAALVSWLDQEKSEE